ncbi:hypothetical protein ANCDUO_21734, partial [Ancylostoma duodenale]
KCLEMNFHERMLMRSVAVHRAHQKASSAVRHKNAEDDDVAPHQVLPPQRPPYQCVRANVNVSHHRRVAVVQNLDQCGLGSGRTVAHRRNPPRHHRHLMTPATGGIIDDDRDRIVTQYGCLEDI